MSTIAITIFVNQKILLPTLLTIEEVEIPGNYLKI